MQLRPDGARLTGTVLVTAALGVLVLGGLFAGMQILTGQLNMADVLHRLPKPMAAAFVDDPDHAVRLACDHLDETDPGAVSRYAAEHGLSVEFVPGGEEPARLDAVEWVYWRDRLIARAGDGRVEARVGGACPG